MRWTVLLAFKLTWLLSFTVQARDYLVFTPLPMENPRAVVENSQGLALFLENLLAKPVRIHYVADYDEILRQFALGEIDLVHLGPFNYVMLRQRTEDVMPLVGVRERDGRDYYQCSVVTSIDGVARISEISRGFALTQPLSTCGPFMASYLLAQQGNRLARLDTAFLGTHDAVALAVVRQDFEAGTLSSTIASKYVPLGLKVLATSEPLPLFTLAVNRQRLSAETVALIQHELQQLTPEQTQDWGLGEKGFVTISDEDYDVIRRLKVAKDVNQTP